MNSNSISILSMNWKNFLELKLNSHFMIVSLTRSQKSIRECRIVHKIWKILSLQTKTTMKCVIGSILARHPASRKKISCVKLNSWLIREYFHYSLFHWKLNDADHPHFILKIPGNDKVMIITVVLLCWTRNIVDYISKPHSLCEVKDC